jgi:hypothetical protein
LAYQPPASSTFLSQQTIHQQPASSTLLSEQTSTSHQPPTNRTSCLSVSAFSGNGRSSPNDKLLLVQCLKRKGHVVAPTLDDASLQFYHFYNSVNLQYISPNLELFVIYSLFVWLVAGDDLL